jgi:hypothetical protein
MIAAQLIAAHNATMECYRRAMNEQTFESRRENLSQANKLSRTYAVLLDALNRHRGKGQQKVTVEHVHVHSGGQAIVGAVESSKSSATKRESGNPYDARQITHAPQPSLRSKNADAELVPSASTGITGPDNREGFFNSIDPNLPSGCTHNMRDDHLFSGSVQVKLAASVGSPLPL